MIFFQDANKHTNKKNKKKYITNRIKRINNFKLEREKNVFLNKIFNYFLLLFKKYKQNF